METIESPGDEGGDGRLELRVARHGGVDDGSDKLSGEKESDKEGDEEEKEKNSARTV